MSTVVLQQLNPPSIPGIGTLPSNTVFGWMITPETAQDLVTSFAAIGAIAGYTGTATSTPVLTADGNPTGSTVWSLIVSKPGYTTQTGGDGDWIIFDGAMAVVMSNHAVVAEYTTADVPLVWPATTTAPNARLNSDNTTVTLTFLPPTSANGPWTYQVAGGGTVTITSDRAGNLIATISGLSAGQYSWTVTVTDNFGATGTSLTSNTITIG
jgi:hypothetical protein